MKQRRSRPGGSGEQFRHELKYRISEEEHDLLKLRLPAFLSPDPHAEGGSYLIRSLYFDDYWNSAYEDKDSGVLMRKKYRIRIYNYSDRIIRLERKKKFERYIFKESAPLTREQLYAILEGSFDFLLHSPHPLLQEFYVECVCSQMRPRTIVDYDREPWVRDEGTVRLTFDRDCVGESVISEVSRSCGINLNIVLANVDIIDGAPLGGMVTVLSGTPENLEKALRHFERAQIKVRRLA